MTRNYFMLLSTSFIFLNLSGTPSQASKEFFEQNFHPSSNELAPGALTDDVFFKKNSVLNILTSLKNKQVKHQEKYHISFDIYPRPPLQNALDYLIKYLQDPNAEINLSSAFWENNGTEFYASWTGFNYYYDEAGNNINFALIWTLNH